jgi:hypothetical protein
LYPLHFLCHWDVLQNMSERKGREAIDLSTGGNISLVLLGRGWRGDITQAERLDIMKWGGKLDKEPTLSKLGRKYHYQWIYARKCPSPVYSTLLSADKKKIKLSLYLRKFWTEQMQSHIWLTASSYMVKYLRISSYKEALPPIWLIYMRKTWFSLLSVCGTCMCVQYNVHCTMLMTDSGNPGSAGVTGRQFYTGLPSVGAGESGGGGTHSAHSLLLSPQ